MPVSRVYVIRRGCGGYRGTVYRSTCPIIVGTALSVILAHLPVIPAKAGIQWWWSSLCRGRLLIWDRPVYRSTCRRHCGLAGRVGVGNEFADQIDSYSFTERTAPSLITGLNAERIQTAGPDGKSCAR